MDKIVAMVEPPFIEFVRIVVSGTIQQVKSGLLADPSSAVTAASVGASRRDSKSFFFGEISHYLYAGDTALHLAAASFRRPVAELLVMNGANCRAKNRRGAEPLHYAADANHWNPIDQADMIGFLLAVGADPNAKDASGVNPLHRAVRTRSAPAVQALLKGGADPMATNGFGSTPLHMAVQTTGRSESGSSLAQEQQAAIIKLLFESGADPTIVNSQGKDVFESTRIKRVRLLIAHYSG